MDPRFFETIARGEELFAQFAIQACVASVVLDMVDVDAEGTIDRSELFIRMSRFFRKDLDQHQIALC